MSCCIYKYIAKLKNFFLIWQKNDVFHHHGKHNHGRLTVTAMDHFQLRCVSCQYKIFSDLDFPFLTYFSCCEHSTTLFVAMMSERRTSYTQTISGKWKIFAHTIHTQMCEKFTTFISGGTGYCYKTLKDSVLSRSRFLIFRFSHLCNEEQNSWFLLSLHHFRSWLREKMENGMNFPENHIANILLL